MALLRWDPHDMDRLRDDMNRMWSRVRDDWNLDGKPRTRLHQIDNGYVVEFELPGVPPDQVRIEVDENTVAARGEFPPPISQPGAKPETFHAIVELPGDINPDTAEADWRHGLLKVTVYKATGRRRTLEIKAH